MPMTTPILGTGGRLRDADGPAAASVAAGELPRHHEGKAMVEAPDGAQRGAWGGGVTAGRASRGPAPEIAESTRKSEPRT